MYSKNHHKQSEDSAHKMGEMFTPALYPADGYFLEQWSQPS